MPGSKGASVTARRIGREGRPLVQVDGFSRDADALRTAALAATFGPAGHHYPGIRAPLPPGYLAERRDVIAEVVREAFGFRRSLRLLDAAFSIVTTPPAALTTEQRLPHVDAVAPGRIALVHYLSPDGGDGTAFFRHRATGFETIDEGRAAAYYARLAEELREAPPPAAYVAETTPLFERIALGEARWDRAYIYASGLLHSGAIAPDARLSPDPAVGRLTVTAFFEAA